MELHESCGRTKLFWLLALADSKTLKAMVEFRDGSHTIISGPQEAVGRCRFCGLTGNSGLLEIGNVCADAQCQEYAANSCLKTKPCGHACGGVAGERKCLPCLQHVCHARENELAEELRDPKLTQDADDMCMICFVEALSCAPSIHVSRDRQTHRKKETERDSVTNLFPLHAFSWSAVMCSTITAARQCWRSAGADHALRSASRCAPSARQTSSIPC